MTGITILYFIIYVQDTLTNRNSFSEMLLFLVWMALGAGLALRTRKDFGRISREEREVLIFGEKMARRRQ